MLSQTCKDSAYIMPSVLHVAYAMQWLALFFHIRCHGLKPQAYCRYPQCILGNARTVAYATGVTAVYCLIFHIHLS